MGSTRTFHSAADRSAAIRRLLDERSMGPCSGLKISISGDRVMLDGTVDAYAEKEAALDAALLAGEAEVVVDRIRVRRPAMR